MPEDKTCSGFGVEKKARKSRAKTDDDYRASIIDRMTGRKRRGAGSVWLTPREAEAIITAMNQAPGPLIERKEP